MPYDSTPPEQPKRPHPPEGMWHNPHCQQCRGHTAYGNGEACNICGKFEDGSDD